MSDKTTTIELKVNGKTAVFHGDPETPLLYALRNDLGLVGAKFGCGLEQCQACKVLVDGVDVPSCQLPVRQVAGLAITTIEGLAENENPTAEQLHPLQAAFVEEQAIQCGYCASGMIIAAQGLLNRVRHPTDADIREALGNHICRCGVYERVRRAIKLRIGQPYWEPIYEVIEPDPIAGLDDAPTRPQSNNLAQNPDLDGWIRFNGDETVTIFTGKVEIGQGIKTAVSQIAADELDVAIERIRVQTADTSQSPDEGGTTGSMSVEMSGYALRQAAATARHILLSMAFEALEAETPAADLVVNDGTIHDPATGREISYWALLDKRPFGQPVRADIPPKDPNRHKLVGQPLKRADLIPKVTGQACYVHDLHLPGMVHGRVVRPPAYAARLISVDETAVRQLPGVLAVVRDGSFLGVVAEREEQAIWASEKLRETAVWDNPTQLINPADLTAHLQANVAESNLVLDGTAVSDPIPPKPAANDAHQTIRASYSRPYQMHGSLGPSAAVAQWQAGKLTLWSHTQAPHLLQATIAETLGVASDAVRLIHSEGSGCYGHNGADDVTLDAALLARAVPERPLSLKWMREDEHLWEPYGPAMVVELEADLTETGEVAAWYQDIWSYSHISRSRPTGGDHSGLLAAWHLERPFAPSPPRNLLGRHFGGYRNADPLYAFPQRRILSHFVPNSPLRTSALRSLGAYANIFAIESFIDELAAAAHADPVAFRLQHLTDERAKAVIEAAAKKAGWQPRSTPTKNGRGRGIAFAQYKNIQCYTAIVVELTVDRDSGKIQLERAIIAADAGQIVNPDGLSNQLEGGFVQAASWTLAEAVAFDEQGLLSKDWESYPVLSFTGVPTLETVLLNRPLLPSVGSGEASQNPTPAAIANAIYDAIGVRLRDIPFTETAVCQAIARQQTEQ